MTLWRRNNPEKWKEYQKTNREEIKNRKQAWQDENREKTRDYLLQKTYGMTLEQWNLLFESQGQKCAICGTSEPGRKNQTWSTDHCHETGKVRGILCHHCNTGLGGFKDDPESLLKAIEYLKRLP